MQRFGRAATEFENRRKHHLHRKTQVLLCELSNAYALLISRSDLLLFLTKMDALLPETKIRCSPSELLSDRLFYTYFFAKGG